MALKKLQPAISVDRHAETRASTAASGVDDLLALTDDELTALMPSVPESNLSLRAGEALPPQGPAARPSPKASGKFVTDGGRLVGPKIVKRIKKREEAVPNKASGAYAKAVVPATQAEPAAPSTRLEDFSDLVSELESLVDLPRQVDPALIPNDQVQGRLAEAPRVFEANADVHATITEAVQAALPQMTTVPLSVATAQTAARARAAAGAEARVEAEDVASTSTSTTADAMRAPPIAAAPVAAERAPARRGRFATLLTAVALLGVVGAAGWMAWRHGLVTQPQTAVVAPAAPPAEATTVAVVPATVVPAAPATPAEPTEAAEEKAATSDVAPTVASTKPAPPPARKVAAPTGATGEGTAAVAEPAKGEARVAAKPARRARATKASDSSRSNGPAGDEIDQETKKALEALQKSQLESSF